MAIAKLTKSGKAILFVDDIGNVFITPVSNILKMIHKGISSEFVLFNRMPTMIPQDKFKVSPVYQPETNTMRTAGEYDPMGAVKKKEEEGKYEDKVLL